MNYKCEIYKDEKGEYRWRVVADNGNILGDSSEGYKNKEECKCTAEKILNRKNVEMRIDPIDILKK